MRIALSWLRDFLLLTQEPQAIADALTAGGLEVEGIDEHTAVRGGLQQVAVGHVLEVVPHPGADRLRICKVDVGQGEPAQIVCGAANVAVGQKVPVALPGAVLYPNGSEEPLKIKTGKIRGEVSAGMICAEDELGIGTSHEGILVLDDSAVVGEPAAKALGLESDFIFEIGLTPNRGDAASHLGVARDLSASLKLELCQPSASLPGVLRQTSLTVSIEKPEDAPHYHAIRIEGVQVGPSPAWLQKRLASIGVATLNNVVDVTNYLCHHLGQPMHVFDADKLAGNTLSVRRAGAAVQLSVLDKRTLTLHPDDLVIADASGPIALAGAMGGTSTAVSAETKNVVLEVACFHPVAVRKTASRHAIKTDSSFRFERGVDAGLVASALPLAVRLIEEVSGGKAVSAPAAATGIAPAARTIEVRKEKLLALIGQHLEDALIADILTRLGFGLTANTEGWTVDVPSYRLYDVEGLADIAEEVIRIFGLNNLNLPESLGVRFFDTAPGWKSFDLQALIGRQLASEGFVEIVTNSLTAAGNSDGLTADEAPVTLLNPLSEELSQMRRSPLPATLEAIAYNANRRQKSLKTFEFGRVYGKAEQGYVEHSYLTLAVWGQPEPTWQGKPEPLGYADLSASVQKLLARLGVKAGYQPADHPTQFAECVALTVGKKEVALLGEVAPGLVKKADLKGRVYAAVIWWEAIQRYLAKPVFKAAEPPKFPEVRRDLSLVVDASVTYAELRTAALEAERKLLREVQLFDVFSGASLGDGKKAYALAFTLADPEATLTDAQIDAAMQRLEKRFADKLGAVVRR